MAYWEVHHDHEIRQRTCLRCVVFVLLRGFSHHLGFSHRSGSSLREDVLAVGVAAACPRG